MAEQKHSSFRPHIVQLLGGAALMAAVLIGVGTAEAQVPDAQTGIASPGRVEEQVRTQRFERRAVPKVETTQAPLAGAPAGSEKITFKLDKIVIEGVTVYKEGVLRKLYVDRIGQTISLADLYGIAADMTRKYRNDGYILTQVVVPPQTIEGGTAHLNIIEGYVDQVNVAQEEGARPESESAMRLIRDYAGRITTGRALNVRDLERYMLLINDLPGISARGVLAPSQTRVGAADLNILVQRAPVEGIIAIDNYGTRYLGPVQLSGAASLNSLMGNNERLTGQVVAAPEPGNGLELGYVSLGYEQPLNASGLKFEISANYTATEPGYTLDDFDVHGYSRYLRAGFSYPVIRSRATSLYTNVMFDIRNVDTSNNIEDTRKDRIRALRAGARFEHLDTLFGAGLNIIDAEIAQGLDFMGATTENDVNKSRAEGEGDFTKLNVEIQRLQRVVDNVNLLVGVRGQLSNEALLSAEEFGVGGLAYGRSYDPSEIIGDDGVAGKVELQWNVPGTFLTILHDNQVFGFFDAGKVWNDDPLVPGQDTDTATSAGFGLHSKIEQATSMDLTVAFPLNRDVQTQNDRDPRVYFSLSRKF